MPAGPEPSTTRTTADLPDYPAFRRRLIADCHRLGAPTPDDRIIASEYIYRAGLLARAQAADQIAAWNAQHREREGASRP